MPLGEILANLMEKLRVRSSERERERVCNNHYKQHFMGALGISFIIINNKDIV